MTNKEFKNLSIISMRFIQKHPWVALSFLVGDGNKRCDSYLQELFDALSKEVGSPQQEIKW